MLFSLYRQLKVQHDCADALSFVDDHPDVWGLLTWYLVFSFRGYYILVVLVDANKILDVS